MGFYYNPPHDVVLGRTLSPSDYAGLVSQLKDGEVPFMHVVRHDQPWNNAPYIDGPDILEGFRRQEAKDIVAITGFYALTKADAIAGCPALKEVLRGR